MKVGLRPGIAGRLAAELARRQLKAAFLILFSSSPEIVRLARPPRTRSQLPNGERAMSVEPNPPEQTDTPEAIEPERGSQLWRRLVEAGLLRGIEPPERLELLLRSRSGNPLSGFVEIGAPAVPTQPQPADSLSADAAHAADESPILWEALDCPPETL